MGANRIIVPRDGLAGLKENWKFDIVSGFVIFLIALPLCLGIALASDAPPMAGIITGVIGGVICGFISGSYVTINGPAAGLIVIVLGAIGDLGYQGALAVGVLCGVFQIILGFLRAGKLTNFFPLSVVHGMLAGIGVIIMAKQIHVALGQYESQGSMLQTLLSIPASIADMPVQIASIGLLCVFIMLVWPFMRPEFIQKIPAPLVAVIIAVGMSGYFGLGDDHLLKPLLPASLAGGFAFPDFSVFGVQPAQAVKWFIMYLFVASLESLLTASAVDKLDPWKRRSDMNREFVGKGVANALSGLIGGLPMIAEVVRSAANIQNGARTRWSNFFHGLFLLICVAFFTQYLAMIPKAALAGILVVIGYRLAHPLEFIRALRVGKEEFAFMATTTIVVVLVDLLMGIFAGMIVAILVSVIRSAAAGGMGPALKRLFFPSLEIDAKGEIIVVRFADALGFGNFMGVRGKLDKLPPGQVIRLDFSQCVYVDHTVVERLNDFALEYARTGGKVEKATSPLRRATRHAASALIR